MCEFNYGFIENQIGYKFKNKNLIRQAFVRRSYSEEHGGENNEVLEFYGDKVLDFIVSKVFYEHYGNGEYNSLYNSVMVRYGEFISEYNEEKLTEFRKLLVRKQSLADCIYDLDLGKYLYLGKNDEENDARNNDSVMEDLFEAILGAAAIDTGWNIEKMQDTVDVMLNLSQFFSDENYVSDITGWTIDKYRCVPEFRFYRDVMPRTTYENSIHCSNLTQRNYCELILGDYEFKFLSDGKTRGEAKNIACKFAYEHLLEKDLLNPLKNEIDEPSEDMAINDLETLARRGYFELPKYKFTETHDKNGNPIWKVTCLIDGFDNTEARDSSKKKAKKKAAYKMLIYVIENYYDEED